MKQVTVFRQHATDSVIQPINLQTVIYSVRKQLTVIEWIIDSSDSFINTN